MPAGKPPRNAKERIAASAEPPEIIGDSTLINGAHAAPRATVRPAGAAAHCSASASGAVAAPRGARRPPTARPPPRLAAQSPACRARPVWLTRKAV